jgi:hypothetical protein
MISTEPNRGLWKGSCHVILGNICVISSGKLTIYLPQLTTNKTVLCCRLVMNEHFLLHCSSFRFPILSLSHKTEAGKSERETALYISIHSTGTVFAPKKIVTESNKLSTKVITIQYVFGNQNNYWCHWKGTKRKSTFFFSFG